MYAPAGYEDAKLLCTAGLGSDCREVRIFASGMPEAFLETITYDNYDSGKNVLDVYVKLRQGANDEDLEMLEKLIQRLRRGYRAAG